MLKWEDDPKENPQKRSLLYVGFTILLAVLVGQFVFPSPLSLPEEIKWAHYLRPHQIAAAELSTIEKGLLLIPPERYDELSLLMRSIEQKPKGGIAPEKNEGEELLLTDSNGKLHSVINLDNELILLDGALYTPGELFFERWRELLHAL